MRVIDGSAGSHSESISQPNYFCDIDEFNEQSIPFIDDSHVDTEDAGWKHSDFQTQFCRFGLFYIFKFCSVLFCVLYIGLSL